MAGALRVVLLVTSPRVAAGLLSFPAWTALGAGPVFVPDVDDAAVAPLAAAGADLRVIDPDASADLIALHLVGAARETGTVTLLVGAEAVQPLATAVTSVANEAVSVDVVTGSWDLPGARLLDVVATMDRLRSPGGCPWDAEQDHASLASYLLEEAYETFQAIEDNDLRGLREELGDVLLQVVFHSRLAEELPADGRWSIDDVATGLVDKLVRRHPHVFDGVAVSGSDEVNANWETIKSAERAGTSPLASVPLAAPALTLAATLQRKASRAGLDEADPAPGAEAALQRYVERPGSETAGALLWALVAAMRADDVDPEMALRSRAREFRDGVEQRLSDQA